MQTCHKFHVIVNQYDHFIFHLDSMKKDWDETTSPRYFRKYWVMILVYLFNKEGKFLKGVTKVGFFVTQQKILYMKQNPQACNYQSVRKKKKRRRSMYKILI